jgi:hypothetical protein
VPQDAFHRAGFTRLTGIYLTQYLTDVNYWVMATGDFNRDGMTDLIWRHQTEQHCVAYWLMNPAAPLTTLSSGCVADAPVDFKWQIVAPK